MTTYPPYLTLQRRLARALEKTRNAKRDIDAVVIPASNARFGDYQTNAAIQLAKLLNEPPREVAQSLLDAMSIEDFCEHAEVSGPGFINFFVRNPALSEWLRYAADHETLGVLPSPNPDSVIIDYSSPNVAKEMHVGHLRSTIIGDALARVLDFRGHRVIRQNHLGDWGTQFGMLIQYLIEEKNVHRESRLEIQDLDVLYQNAKQLNDRDEQFSRRAKQRVVALQRGEPATLAIWRKLTKESERHFQAIYERLGVLLKPEDTRGESFFNSLLAETVEDLEDLGLAETSEGAKIVQLEHESLNDGSAPSPRAMVIRKSDGGYLYATTDLAAIRFRIDSLGATRILYVVDARQTDHFRSVFWTARAAGWAPREILLEHVPFGMILGHDGRPFQTREGGTVKLVGLLQRAVEKAQEILRERPSHLSESEEADVAEAVGLGALKFADLANDRRKDYVFDEGRMLSFEGMTAPYIQNAHVRIQGILRKCTEDAQPRDIRVLHPDEKAVALKLAEFQMVLEGVERSLEPHRLCRHLYELATVFHRFYETCPVLGTEDGRTRRSRLALCEFVGRSIAKGLELTGITALDRM